MSLIQEFQQKAQAVLDDMTRDYFANCQKVADMANVHLPLNTKMVVSFSLPLDRGDGPPIRARVEIVPNTYHNPE